jgi:DNA-binding MurR/RpiR family transcriptional regulator
LKPSARVCLELGPQANTAFQSLAAPMCLAQVLVVCTGQRLAQLDQKRQRRRTSK